MKRVELDKSQNVTPPPLESLRLNGLNVAVIGGTGGIGRALSHQFAAKGANVLVVGQTFRDQEVPRITFLRADLSSMRDARRIGAELPAGNIDIVVFTTGIMAGPKREVTPEGIERDLAVSYLSRLVILNEIAPRLGKDRTRTDLRPRIFVMGFPGTEQKADVDDLNSEQGYRRFSAHSNTVSGNEVLVLQAARRFPDVDVFGLNPGFVRTNIRANLLGSRACRRRGMADQLHDDRAGYIRRAAGPAIGVARPQWPQRRDVQQQGGGHPAEPVSQRAVLCGRPDGGVRPFGQPRVGRPGR